MYLYLYLCLWGSLNADVFVFVFVSFEGKKTSHAVVVPVAIAHHISLSPPIALLLLYFPTYMFTDQIVIEINQSLGF